MKIQVVAMILLSAISASATASRVVIRADFGKWVDYPLVKTKFAAYNSGYVPGHLETYKRDVGLFDEVHPDALRIDGVLGSPRHMLFSDPPIISGEPPDLKYDFRQADELIDLMRTHNVQKYWCYGYVPEALGESFKTPPSDLAQWGTVCRTLAKHFASSGHTVAYHEIYNEPDNRDFFSGTVQDYIAMYETAVRAIRAADPDAVVGGPALAFTDAWIEPFLGHVTKNHLPLDFFSFHYYPGVPYKAQSLREVVETMREALRKHPELATTEMHLNEYNSLPINYPKDGPQQKHRLAAQLLSDFSYFVTQPSLTKVHWAQFMDTGGGNWSGLISIGGRRKAAFNAWKLYSMMPTDRRLVSIEGPQGIGAMASSDEHKCGLVVWNLTGADQTVRVHLDSIPLAKATLRVYRIDAGHASWGDDPANERLAPVEERRDVGTVGLEWTGDIPDGGVVYLEAQDGTTTADPAHVAEVERIHYCFPDRNSKAYADFDRNTWTARMGMGGEQAADAVVGVRASNLPTVLGVSYTVGGKLQDNGPHSLLAVQVDYEASGEYRESVLFHKGIFHANGITPLPWGTKARPEQAVRFDDTLDLGKYAPEGWAGRAIITFRIRNTGPDNRAKISLERRPL
ncbi:MAG: cellulase family glycosylhydrolase [Armatimonadetes bacterium]|nr:cellulase family glycosylhydrolase [Armatimonadota bacterium]